MKEKAIDNKERSLNRFIEDAVVNFWNLPALFDLDGVRYTYSAVGENIEKLHILFNSINLKKGDKVAICGKNSSDWMIVFLSCLTYGATAVPILHEFNSLSVTNLVNHSDARLLFADKAIIDKLNIDEMPALEGGFYITERGMAFSRNENLTHARERLNELFGEKYPEDFTPDQINYYKDKPDDVALINYTSGSTGTPKGVVLPYLSLWSNILYCIEHLKFLKPGDGMVNMLPLGHMYGMVIESLHPFVKGCRNTYISKVPSPRILLSAFSYVKPKLIITVPLVLEKIIRTNVFPKIQTPLMKFLLNIPGISDVIYKNIREKLINIFGGQLVEIIIGGAPLNEEVEKFLYRIKFPVTVGYGMTECGPLLAYCPHAGSRPRTVGKIVDRMEVKIDSPDPEKIPGNILVRGDNVMKEYYKNPDATADVFSSNDGWMNTGDMGTISPDGMISISGRSKTMILGPSGQNIYPEDIEQHLNNIPLVEESLVIELKGKLIALIFPNYSEAEAKGLTGESLKKYFNDKLKEVNGKLENFSRISSFKLMDKEFEKTPKKSIKRFLYQSHS